MDLYQMDAATAASYDTTLSADSGSNDDDELSTKDSIFIAVIVVLSTFSMVTVGALAYVTRGGKESRPMASDTPMEKF
jgi:hypothetical protein